MSESVMARSKAPAERRLPTGQGIGSHWQRGSDLSVPRDQS